MCFRGNAAVRMVLTIALLCLPLRCLPSPPRDKNIWNYDGGVSLITNGSIPDGPCFRISGRVTAPGFFDNLKGIDTEKGAIFRRGAEGVTSFPDKVVLTFIVRHHYDQTCPQRMENTGSPKYLTRAAMRSLELYVDCEHGVEIRPIANAESKYFSVDPIIPYAVARAHDLPERLQWSYEYAIPSAGVPLTDSLVLVLRTPDGHIVARVAARL